MNKNNLFNLIYMYLNYFFTAQITFFVNVIAF